MRGKMPRLRVRVILGRMPAYYNKLRRLSRQPENYRKTIALPIQSVDRSTQPTKAIAFPIRSVDPTLPRGRILLGKTIAILIRPLD